MKRRMELAYDQERSEGHLRYLLKSRHNCPPGGYARACALNAIHEQITHVLSLRARAARLWAMENRRFERAGRLRAGRPQC